MTRSGRWLLGQRLGFSEQLIQVIAAEAEQIHPVAVPSR